MAVVSVVLLVLCCNTINISTILLSINIELSFDDPFYISLCCACYILLITPSIHVFLNVTSAHQERILDFKRFAQKCTGAVNTLCYVFYKDRDKYVTIVRL